LSSAFASLEVARGEAFGGPGEERVALLHCCSGVAAADNEISPSEEAELRQITNELGLEHADFIAARTAHRDAVPLLRK
jgi:hypothetical protein